MFFGLNIKSCVFLVNIINAVGCCYISCILVHVCILYFIFNSSFVSVFQSFIVYPVMVFDLSVVV